MMLHLLGGGGDTRWGFITLRLDQHGELPEDCREEFFARNLLSWFLKLSSVDFRNRRQFWVMEKLKIIPLVSILKETFLTTLMSDIGVVKKDNLPFIKNCECVCVCVLVQRGRVRASHTSRPSWICFCSSRTATKTRRLSVFTPD